MKHTITVLLLSLGFSASSNAQVAHYVKNGGNDTNTGLSDEQAWASIEKVRNHTYIPGDSILFKRGDKWVVTSGSNSLNVDTYSGIPGHRIIYSSYGVKTLPKPIITGRQPVTGWNTPSNWTNRGDNNWSMLTNLNGNIFYANNKGRLWLNGSEVQINQSSTSVTFTQPWTHDLLTLYVFATSNPATFYSNIESIGVNYSIMSCTKDYITFRNLDFQGGGGTVQVTGADSLIVEDCNIGLYSGGSGLVAVNCNNVIIRSNIFDTGEKIYDLWNFTNSEDGLFISNSNNWDVSYNKFKNWSHTGLNIQSYGNDPITNIKYHNNYHTAPDIDYGRPMAYQIAPGGFGLCTGNEIYNNFAYDCPTQTQISGDGLKFYNNIIDRVRGIPWRVSDGSDGLNLSTYYSDCKNNEICNNIIMNARDNGISMPFTSGRSFGNNLIRNNIIINNGLYQINIGYSPGFLETQTFENNLLYKSGQTDVVFYGYNMSFNFNRNIEEFNAENGDKGNIIKKNINSDPLFIDTNNPDYLKRDYHLQDSSRAVGAGIGISWLKTDYAGNPWPNPPNIGVFSAKGKVIPPPPGKLAINIYPNPAREFIYISLKEPSLISYTVRIFSSSGKLFIEKIMELGNKELKIPIVLNSGIYIVQVLSGKTIMGAQTLAVIN